MIKLNAARMCLASVGVLSYAAILLVGIERCKVSWFDEAVYSAQAISFATDGNLSSIYAPIAQYPDFEIFIVRPFLLGGFLKIFGVGLLQIRSFNAIVLMLTAIFIAGSGRLIGYSWRATFFAFALALVERALFWQVRAGRPDGLAVLFLCIAACAAIFVVTRLGSKALLFPCMISGFSAVMATFTHAYALPGCIFIACAAVTSILKNLGFGRRSLSLITAAVGGVLLGGLSLVVYIFANWNDFLSVFELNSRFLSEQTADGTTIGKAIIDELAFRWGRGTFVQIPLWFAFVLVFVQQVRSKFTTDLFQTLLLLWILLYFLTLWLLVPVEHMWYQVVFISPPLVLMVAALADCGEAGSAWRVRLKRRLPSFALCWSFLLASPYALVSLYQWNERDYRDLVTCLQEKIPLNSKLVVDFGAFIAAREAGFEVYSFDFYRRPLHESPFVQQEYKQTVCRNCEYLVLEATRKPKSVPGFTFQDLAVIGEEHGPAPLVSDGQYFFRIWKIIRNL